MKSSQNIMTMVVVFILLTLYICILPFPKCKIGGWGDIIKWEGWWEGKLSLLGGSDQ